MWFYYFWATLIVWQGIMSLRGGKDYLRFVRRETSRVAGDFAPYASVIAPCCGVEQHLDENLRAIFAQNYPAYEIIFVVAEHDDPAVGTIEALRREHDQSGRVRSHLIVAGRARESGQKVHNLLAALLAIETHSEIVVFVDSDAQPHAGWLRSLVSPLADESVGASSGYRWYVPDKNDFAAKLRAVWNASVASALGANTSRNFCWGGATAIRRTTLIDTLHMNERWRGTLSDDFALTRALRAAHLPIRFVPQCLTVSREDCSFKELLEFTTRQMKITRVYAPHLWQIVLWTNAIFVAVFFGGIALAIARAITNRSYVVVLCFIATIFTLGAAKAVYRLRAVCLAMPAEREKIIAIRAAYLMFWPLTSALYLWNAVTALFSRRITWRGISYELKSPHDTIIIHASEPRGRRADERVSRIE